MAKIEQKHVLTAVEKRKFFRERLLERIREQIGTENADQAIREQILLDICAKITAVYVGCFGEVEQALGKEVWAYMMDPDQFASMSYDEQEKCKVLSLIWDDCKNAIKHIGNNVITDIIYILSQVDFTERDGANILAIARLREQRRVEDAQTNQGNNV